MPRPAICVDASVGMRTGNCIIYLPRASTDVHRTIGLLNAHAAMPVHHTVRVWKTKSAINLQQLSMPDTCTAVQSSAVIGRINVGIIPIMDPVPTYAVLHSNGILTAGAIFHLNTTADSQGESVLKSARNFTYAGIHPSRPSSASLISAQRGRCPHLCSVSSSTFSTRCRRSRQHSYCRCCRGAACSLHRGPVVKVACQVQQHLRGSRECLDKRLRGHEKHSGS